MRYRKPLIVIGCAAIMVAVWYYFFANVAVYVTGFGTPAILGNVQVTIDSMEHTSSSIYVTMTLKNTGDAPVRVCPMPQTVVYAQIRPRPTLAGQRSRDFRSATIAPGDEISYGITFDAGSDRSEIVELVLPGWVIGGRGTAHFRLPTPPPVTVEVTKVSVSRMPDHLRSQPHPPGLQMGVQVRLMVHNQGKDPIPWAEWGTHPHTPASHLARLYADGQEVKVVMSPFMKPAAPIPSESPMIVPGQRSTVHLIFSQVPDEAQKLELALPGEAVGQEGEFRVTVPLPDR